MTCILVLSARVTGHAREACQGHFSGTWEELTPPLPHQRTLYQLLTVVQHAALRATFYFLDLQDTVLEYLISACKLPKFSSRNCRVS